MGFLGSIFGGGPNGSNSSAQSLANSGPNGVQIAQTEGPASIVNPVTPGQYNGINAQSQAALAQQQSLVNSLGAQNATGNQNSVYAQQQALANQLGTMAQGGGPNPALTQLQATTGQNVSQQAALMADQRGAGANAGLIARQAAQQGAATQQQAVGQAATLRANQQLAAIGALQGQQQSLGGLATQQVGQQLGAVNQLASSAQAQQGLGLQAIGQQQAATESLNQANIQNTQAYNQSQIANTQQYNNAAVSQQNSINAANASIANNNANNQSKASMGLLGGIAAALAKGGTVPGYAEGGGVVANSQNARPLLKENYEGKGARSKVARRLTGMVKSPKLMGGQGLAEGGMALDMKVGGHVPGKALVGGAKDSYTNDTVDARLSPGEIVLPRSVTKSADPIRASAEFVAKEIAKRSKGGKR